MLEAMREDVGEPHDDGSRELPLLETLHDVVQIDLACRVHVRTNHEMARGIHTEVTFAPTIDLVELRRVFD
jgi:hypothetical protein